MTDAALDSVLRLVAEGRLSATEAAPILDALDSADHMAHDSRSAGEAATSPGDGPGRAIRLQVTEGGRKVVNLRVPLSLGQAALSRIPGLSESLTDRIRDALDAGVRGPILDVDEGSGDGVRVVIE